LGFYLLDVFGRRDHRFFNRFSVAFIGWLNRHRDHSARLKIDRMLGFMSQCVRPSFILVMRASESSR
jgi:hypothetical protein